MNGDGGIYIEFQFDDKFVTIQGFRINRKRPDLLEQGNKFGSIKLTKESIKDFRPINFADRRVITMNHTLSRLRKNLGKQKSGEIKWKLSNVEQRCDFTTHNRRGKFATT